MLTLQFLILTILISPGLYLDGDTCIPVDQCPCIYDNKKYSSGEAIIERCRDWYDMHLITIQMQLETPVVSIPNITDD